ncbi:ubiquitin carboxyl-terminal hydrolase 47-like isoform X2 [Neocloeon triangulifer]|nr:ubiquitin carboxyl-terminal hydrolase 47-like isoform X2 [Neocloeon triangulifer]XP_059471101.1 ubiquitin carboxyl-terminal hydrolase 47-like isoform X2 [Neocloeon triangulifer]
MVCQPQLEEQEDRLKENLQVSNPEATMAVVPVQEEPQPANITCIVRNHVDFSTNSGPITIFVKENATVAGLYGQIANQLELNESDFDINFKTEVLPKTGPSPSVLSVGIKADGRNMLTLTSAIKLKKKTNLPNTNRFSEEDTTNEIENGAAATAVASTSTEEFATHSVLPAPAIETFEKKYVGLVNQAMTCYLNSLLQSLFMTPEFRNALYKWEFDGTDEESRRKSIPFQLQRLFLKLQTSSKTAVETTDLTRSFGWDSSDSWTQHDVQELCRVMFDALEHKFRKTEQADLINRLYQGKMIDYVKCMECGKENIREDTFLDIPLPIRPFGKETAYGSVEDALNGFIEPETLDGNNQYACENCNKKCDAKKGLKFVKIPYLLTLHLMRFDFDYNSLHRLKLNDKVVFPEILDMNPFISTTAKESRDDEKGDEAEVKKEKIELQIVEPIQEENVEKVAEVGVNDSASSIDNESLPSLEPAEPVLNGDAKVNGAEAEDSVFENGEAACINDNNEKNTRRSLEKGPYMYELYAILIHSGNASGGHYYAYIKDFSSGQWFCFNDQNVTRITSDDIRKTYGGSRAYYNSGYSPSTSAYMLMYRQIDKERNTEVMKVEDFPEHIKNQLAAMQNGDGDSYCRDYLMDTVKLKVFCYSPQSDRQTNCKLNCLGSLTQKEVLQMAHKELNLQAHPIENCRLVSYDSSQYSILGSLHEYEEETIGNIVTTLDGKQNFLLQIKSIPDPWQPFVSGDSIARIFTVNPETEELQGPFMLPVHYRIDALEFKKLMQRYMPELFGSVPVDNISVVLEKFSMESLYPLQEGSQLFDSDSYAATMKKVFVGVNDDEKSFQNSKLYKVIDRYQNIITLVVLLPDLESEDLEDLEIPLLSAYNQQKTEEEEAARERSSPNPPRPQSSLQVAPSSAAASEGNEEDLAASTDQSASEDSSLTDSDRTLVGDQENLLVQLSSPSDESAGGDGQAASSPDDPPQDKEGKNESDWDDVDGDRDGARVSHSRPQSYTYFKATPLDEGSSKMLIVEVDKRVSMAWFKRHLEPFVGVPCDYFKVLRTNDEYDYTSLSPSFRDGDKVNVRLGRALRKGEFTGKVFKLVPDDTDPTKFLFNCTLSNGMLVSDAKKLILKDLKKKNNVEIPLERCRLRKKSWKNPGQVYYDHQKFEESMCLMANWEMFLQELPENWPQKTSEDSLPELVLFVRKWSPSTMTMGPFEEVELSTTTGQELKEKLSGMSGIPAENVGIVKAPGSFPCDISVLTVHTELEWISATSNLNEWPFNIFEDGHVIFYRDNQEQLKELTAEERKELEKAENLRKPRVGASSWTFTPRKERGLRIYLDPTPPKATAPVAEASPNELFSNY